ncbi:lysozyme family protein [Shouchella clausii]|uniref:lysozyme family protein n=1 Tax=Shouchella clausii TaxID=79880 RepID=UPI0026F40E68|nr:lysozyme family protein [Shouchella clausii]MDO7285907.1 lysozyme family protein [Shouchella clausii]MDO7305810.1 lysozyme family protein [Shouchella clausii]
MADLKKEFKDRNDNLHKKESTHLMKDTKSAQTASERALQNSQSKLDYAAQDNSTQKLQSQHTPIKTDYNAQASSTQSSPLISSQDSNNTLNANAQTSSAQKLQPQHSSLNKSDYNAQTNSTQSSPLISVQDSNNTFNANAQSGSTQKLQMQHSHDKLISAQESHNKLDSNAQSSSTQKLQMQHSTHDKLISAQESHNKLDSNAQSSSMQKLQMQHSHDKLISAQESHNKLDSNAQSSSTQKLQMQHSHDKLISAQESHNKLDSNAQASGAQKLQLQRAQNKLLNAQELPNKLDAQTGSAHKLQPQRSEKNLTSARENKLGYETQGSNAKKLQPQRDENELINAKEDNKKSPSKLKEASSLITNKTIKNAATKYKKELERDDQAVQVVSKTTETTAQVSKKIVERIKTFKLKKEYSKANLKLAKASLKDEVKLEKANVADTKAYVKNKLKKDTRQLDQAKKELKVKNEKLKEKKTDLKLVKKEISNNSFIKKASKPAVSLSANSAKRLASNFKKQMESNDEGAEVVGKGISLVKEGSNALAKAKKIKKNSLKQEKLKRISTKLSDGNKTILKEGQKKKLQKTNKTQLKKKMVKKKLYANKEKAKTLSAFSNGVKRLFNNVKSKISFVAFKSLIGKNVAIGAGALFVKLVPLLLIFLLLFGVVAFFMAGGGGYEEQQLEGNIGYSKNLSPDVEQWRELVTNVAEAQGMSDFVPLILAIIQVESGGKGTRDIMQSSESAGYPRNYFQTEEASVQQGISYLKSIVQTLRGFNSGFENNGKLIAQSYNFGSPFANYVGKQGGEYTLEVAETYSRTVVAPSLGNTTGETYSYVNEVSKSVGKTYLYRNGGNFLYGELVGQYLFSGVEDGNFAPPVDFLQVTSHFGNRPSPGGIGSTNHKGIDFACVGGVSPIRAVMPGTVETARFMNGYGNTVILKHSDNLYTLYAHMSSLSVSGGQQVSQSQQIGICGSTGNSTGPHLHFEVSPQPLRNQVDPYPYFQHLIN